MARSHEEKQIKSLSHYKEKQISHSVIVVISRANGHKGLKQSCPTRGPVEGFVRHSLGFRCSKSIPHNDNLSLF